MPDWSWRGRRFLQGRPGSNPEFYEGTTDVETEIVWHGNTLREMICLLTGFSLQITDWSTGHAADIGKQFGHIADAEFFQ